MYTLFFLLHLNERGTQFHCFLDLIAFPRIAMADNHNNNTDANDSQSNEKSKIVPNESNVFIGFFLVENEGENKPETYETEARRLEDIDVVVGAEDSTTTKPKSGLFSRRDFYFTR